MPASGKKTGRNTGSRKNTKTTNTRNTKNNSASLDPKVQDEIFLIGVKQKWTKEVDRGCASYKVIKIVKVF